MNHPVKHFTVLLLLVAAFGGIACAQETNDLFAQGTAMVKSSHFPEAAATFEKSAMERPAVGTLLNAGLAEWERGHAGEAILNWERARWLNPCDHQVTENLDFAREVAQVEEPDLKWSESVSLWLPPGAWVWIAGVSLWVAVGILIVPGVLRWRKMGWHQGLAALAFGVFLFSLIANYGVVSRRDLGFVIHANALLRLTPTGQSEIISNLTPGEPARCLRRHGDYFLIRTTLGEGWIDRGHFGLINPD